MKPSPLVPVRVELFLACAEANREILYTVRSGLIGPSCPDPDLAARALLDTDGADEREAPVLHSTSWRWEPSGEIVLTYLALTKGPPQSASGWKSLVLLAEPAPCNPEKPRPAQIREVDVLSHGLRHMAFLVQQDQGERIRSALRGPLLSLLDSLAPAPAGQLNLASTLVSYSGGGETSRPT